MKRSVLFAATFALPAFLIPFALVCVCSSLLGIAAGRIMADEAPVRRLAARFGAVGGLVMAPLQVAIEPVEWSDPFSLSDVLYVVLTFVRCPLVGAAIGVAVWFLVAGRRQTRNESA